MTIFRHVAAFVLLAVCFAAVAFWGRSYSAGDMVKGYASDEHGVIASSWRGQLVLCWLTFSRDIPRFEWKWSAFALHEMLRYDQPPATRRTGYCGFALSLYGTYWQLSMPYWFLALLALAASLAVRPAPRFRFSLRQALVAVTLAAVVFGLILGTIPRS